ncbi:hypothetical protein D9757_007287 [Collybiopsis confluens]|uniref:HCP-like protein n=1 Tax=Collybiopsis confluens TaxID=2823264 RepID=A0A8H5HG24_9AGAR|nr:hypothetical protein D9757_007287 [Collybiopsis confluens]
MTTTSSYSHSPPAYSPLESLFRRTSSKRRNPPPNVKTDVDTQQLAPVSPLIHTHFRSASNVTASSKDFNSSFMEFDSEELDPRAIFTRDDGARASFDSHQRSHYNSFTPDVELQQRFQYAEDNNQDYASNPGSALRDSWQSGSQGIAGNNRTISHVEHSYYPAFESESESTPSSPIPALVVTSPDYPEYSSSASAAGRTPIVRNAGTVSNYSRPVLASGTAAGDPVYTSGDSDSRTNEMRSPSPNQPPPRARHASSSAPILHPEHLDPDAKRRVLERNLGRRARGESPTPSSSPSAHTASGNDYVHSSYAAASSNSRSRESPSNLSPSAIHSSRTMSTSPLSQSATRSPAISSEPLFPIVVTQPSLSSQSQPLTPPFSTTTTYTQEITLPHRPPSLHADSPVSLYSDAYSFYQLDSASPSPTSTTSSNHNRGPAGSGSGSGNRSPLGQSYNNTRSQQQQQQQHLPPPQVVISPSSPNSNLNSSSPSTSHGTATNSTLKSKAEYYLSLGIKHHESNDLTTSAQYFQKSATEDGGCGVGMLMWGLALRHGWGVEKDERSGFGWVRKAAEGAVKDLEDFRRRVGESSSGGGAGGGTMGKGLSVPGYENDKGAVKAELVLAIYEVGQCFFHAWGVPKDQKMGVSYYRVAAQLGDPDAQGDLGFCLANGKGCKKDRKEAAKWYRAAVAQGYSDVGLAWIHKEKFQ